MDDFAEIRAEDVRRATWSPTYQHRGGEMVPSSYVPSTAAVEAALRIAATGAPMPRLY